MEALSRLEASGIPVLSSLTSEIKSFQQFLGFSEPTIYNSPLVFNRWLRGLSNVPPTWKNLLRVIRDLNLDNLAQQIESDLSVGTVIEPSEMRESETVMAGEGERIR